jgi:Uncharacterized conserved protein
MEKYDELLAQIEQQEKELLFTGFTNETAYTLGCMLVDMANSEDLHVTVDINRFGHQLFHYAFGGTSPDNDRWIRGKIKIASLMNHSSYYCELFFKNKGTTVEENFHLSALDYLPYGGCFPINIANVGMVGTITVSGLASADDHALVTRAIKKYLAGKKQPVQDTSKMQQV